MKTLVNKDNPAIRITAPEIEVQEESQMYLIPVSDYCIPMCIDDWTLVEGEPEFEHRRKDTIYFLETAKKHYADTSEIELTIEWLKSLQPQAKQEWSEEDEKMLRTIISDSSRGVELDSKQISWLKSLKDRGNFPKSNTNSPSEWSEEDEEMFDEALAGVLLARNRMNDTGCIGLAERFEKAYKWLESFRPRPHWKPSEEQMKALSETIAFAPDTFKPKCTLMTLQNDLKKL